MSEPDAPSVWLVWSKPRFELEREVAAEVVRRPRSEREPGEPVTGRRPVVQLLPDASELQRERTEPVEDEVLDHAELPHVLEVHLVPGGERPPRDLREDGPEIVGDSRAVLERQRVAPGRERPVVEGRHGPAGVASHHDVAAGERHGVAAEHRQVEGHPEAPLGEREPVEPEVEGILAELK